MKQNFAKSRFGTEPTPAPKGDNSGARDGNKGFIGDAMSSFKRTKYLAPALAVGAGLTLVAGAPVLLPAALAGGAYLRYRAEKPKITPERQAIYDQAVGTLKDQDKLRLLAAEFEKEGLKDMADHLRKRAALRDLPAEVKKDRREVYKKAMGSTNGPQIALLAKLFKDQGADGAAKHLAIRAESIKASQA